MSFISYERSQEVIAELDVQERSFENVFLSDALGRILAEDIVASVSSPEFETSAMDGYAIQSADQESGRIKIMGDNPAGSEETRIVERGYCIKTFTGSKMPKGADALIPIENVKVDGDSIAIINRVMPGASIRTIGESYHAGDVLIKKGIKISFAEIGVMAGLNKVMVKVVTKPRVAIVSTGSEILDLGEDAQTTSQIRSSNNYTIEAMMRLAGADVIQLGVVKDNADSIMKSFENAMECADIVITTGGVSVGDYDFVKDIIPALGAEVVFKGVNIKPGQHLMVARRGKKFVTALPGFAYSSTVTALLYTLPLVYRMQGKDPSLPIIDAVLQEDFKKRSNKTEFTACNLHLQDGSYIVDMEGKKVGTSAILTNLLAESALMIAGENDNQLYAGERVKVIRLDDL
jgi:molybdopterin molybdotransferase